MRNLSFQKINDLQISPFGRNDKNPIITQSPQIQATRVLFFRSHYDLVCATRPLTKTLPQKNPTENVIIRRVAARNNVGGNAAGGGIGSNGELRE